LDNAKKAFQGKTLQLTCLFVSDEEKKSFMTWTPSGQQVAMIVTSEASVPTLAFTLGKNFSNEDPLSGKNLKNNNAF
jgi:hypothetical protein